MTKKQLDSFDITPLPESEELRFRFRFRGTSQQVEFFAPFHVAETMVNALRFVQRRYKLAIHQRNQRRAKPRLRIVRDDDE